jgi:CRP-like cAMP-binding protein
METLERLLLAHPFLEGLDRRWAVLITGCARNLRFRPGDYLFREGQPADTFYLLREGQVAEELHVPGRAPVVFATVGAGGLVGAAWLLPPYRWPFDARAVEPTRAFGLDAACLRGKCDEDPRLGYDMMKRVLPVLMRRMHHVQHQLLDVYGPQAG